MKAKWASNGRILEPSYHYAVLLEKTDQPTATPGVAVVHWYTPGVYIGTAQGQEVR